MHPDRMFYIVVSGHRDGDYLPERDLSNMDRATTVADIRSGELLNVVHVIEFNIAERIVSDVTEDILKAAGKWHDDPRPFTGQDLQDWLHDHERASRNDPPK
jgi:hypothetical protein